MVVLVGYSGRHIGTISILVYQYISRGMAQAENSGEESKKTKEMQGRVLSIQSHVVHGYVGNKCATLPLYRLGFDVDAIHSVHFSNHSGYPVVQGQVMDGEQLVSVVGGLESNGILEMYTHLMTGYIRSVTMLEKIVDVVRKMKECNPQVMYMCDPVQGDAGKLYCPGELTDGFRDGLVPLATVVTPNQFEAERLTGVEIACRKDAVEVCDRLHAMGPECVVLTSVEFASSSSSLTEDGCGGDDILDEKDGFIWLIASSKKAGEKRELYMIKVEKLDGYFTGTGDLLNALLLGWMHRYPSDLKMALERSIAGLQLVLRDTASCAEEDAIARGWTDDARTKDPLWWRSRELRLVENQDMLLDPPVRWEAEPFEV